MGGKQEEQGKYLFLYIACGMMSLAHQEKRVFSLFSEVHYSNSNMLATVYPSPYYLVSRSRLD